MLNGGNYNHKIHLFDVIPIIIIPINQPPKFNSIGIQLPLIIKYIGAIKKVTGYKAIDVANHPKLR